MSLPPETGDAERPVRPVPEATVSRLAVYLRVLGELRESGVETVSSEELAGVSGVNSAKLRKDLSYLGSYGVRGVGYDVASLQSRLQGELGMDHRQSVALVGVGNLGHALAGYAGFAGRGFPVSALFDVSDAVVGTEINGIPVRHLSEVPEVCAAGGVTIGMVATPAPVAQAACDLLVQGGVQSILNFAPVLLQVPGDVEVRKVDLSVELQVLAFHVARRQPAAAGATPPAPGRDHSETNGSVVS
ncbi:redox-sensing transcriptional repressor Rex [Pseudonocardia sp. HH130630-07]|uniref:redox-sensing transcriptional repressor Rex n=1 Tax=Pseudonocardia sp. HH130630-07 TaxID=1690815 RepID=UPI000814DDDB|nr:redox-sensing transcriptional repressor Rex [Pseudonocardia sp. HH130630-07]ANY07267.1 REX family transcriptional regulator [Pseudonocardia sp. HH130630-07]